MQERASTIESYRSSYSQTQTFQPKSSCASNAFGVPNFIDSIFVRDNRSIKDVLGTTVEKGKSRSQVPSIVIPEVPEEEPQD